MRHSASAPHIGPGYGSGSLFIPPSMDEQMYDAAPIQSMSGSTFGSALWGECHIVPHCSYGGRSVLDVVIDSNRDLVWSATSDGHVSALSFPELNPYTAFYSLQGEVRALVPGDNFVFSLGQSEIRINSVTGAPKSRFATSEKCGELFAASQMQVGQVALGGVSPSIFMFDVEHNRLSLQVGIKSGTSNLKAYRNAAYAGHMDGTISVLDPRTFRSSQTLNSGFTAGVQALDVKDKLLCCSGFSPDRGGSSFLEGIVKLFDLRMMRAIQPVAFAPGAFRLKFHPLFSATLILMAQTGQLQVCDAIGSQSNIQGYHVDTGGGLLFGLDVSSSGETFFVSDSEGFIHQWADRESPKLNLFPKALEQPSPMRAHVNVLPDEEGIPLSMLDSGIWGTKSLLMQKDSLASWPKDLYFLNPTPTPPIPSVYMQNVQAARDGDFILYSHVPRNPGLLRYQFPWPEPVRYIDVPDREEQDLRTSLDAFSPARGGLQHSGSGLNNSETGGAGGGVGVPITPSKPTVLRPPSLYQRKTVSFNRLGVSGFDFEFYNKTPFAGLENSLQNSSLVNAIFQLLFYIPHVKQSLMSHLCDKEFCLSCELGFLFRMLGRSEGQVCEPSNLLRVLEHLPLAKELKLMDSSALKFSDRRAGAALVEATVVGFLKQLKEERTPNEGEPLKPLLTIARTLHTVCATCGNQGSREDVLSDLVKLVYPDENSAQHTFGAVLRESLRKTYSTIAQEDSVTVDWCNRCGNKQPCKATEASIKTLPPMLFVMTNVGAAGRDYGRMWGSVSTPREQKSDMGAPSEGFIAPEDTTSPSWLPSSVRISVDNGVFQVEELAGDIFIGNVSGSNSSSSALYAVTSLLCHVHDPSQLPGPGHSVLHQRMGPAHTTGKTLRNFYLFNDFQVRKTSVKEALSFDGFFKNACVLVLTRTDTEELVPVPEFKNQVSWNPFIEPPLQKNPPASRAVAIAGEDDLPKPGEFLPIDAEFVSLAPEVSKSLPNGTTSVESPMKLSLARVSVLREDGRVLIDDYIRAIDKVDDYLTRFSGLNPGDLDPATSPHPVFNLKTTYLKLLWLVERGCMFVGHGLSKDFSIFNLFVPSNQVRDTVDLFHLPKSRKISLRFLAAYLLNKDIQIETHDSIEDAQSAMAVFRKYQEMQGQGDFEAKLQELYEVGRSTNWQSAKELKEIEEQLVKQFEDKP